VWWVSDCGGFWVTYENQGFIYIMKGFWLLLMEIEEKEEAKRRCI